jgi:iron complex outermembrane receptor protein
MSAGITGTALGPASDSKFSGRAGLIYNFDNGLAPYVSYATSYNPLIGVVFSGQLRAAGDRSADRGRRQVPARSASTVTSAFAYFDLKRQNTPSTDPQLEPAGPAAK